MPHNIIFDSIVLLLSPWLIMNSHVHVFSVLFLQPGINLFCLGFVFEYTVVYSLIIISFFSVLFCRTSTSWAKRAEKSWQNWWKHQVGLSHFWIPNSNCRMDQEWRENWLHVGKTQNYQKSPENQQNYRGWHRNFYMQRNQWIRFRRSQNWIDCSWSNDPSTWYRWFHVCGSPYVYFWY